MSRVGRFKSTVGLRKLSTAGVRGERFADRRTQREDWDAAPPRAPLLAVRRELRVAARRSGLAAQVSRSAHPVREGAAALQRPVR